MFGKKLGILPNIGKIARMNRFRPILSAVFLLSCLCACSSLWDATKEHVFGVEKRSLLVGRVAHAKKAQETTRTVFRDALEEFAATVRHDGGELEKKYRAMLAAYERCEAKAKDLHARIDDVERVSKSLFKEWETEMQEYGNADYRARSREQLSATRSRCQDMISAMRRAEAKIPPVLTVLHDQVLFLKHNLNASALRSLAGEEAKIEADVASLIEEMNRAIAESEAFIATLES